MAGFDDWESAAVFLHPPRARFDEDDDDDEDEEIRKKSSPPRTSNGDGGAGGDSWEDQEDVGEGAGEGEGEPASWEDLETQDAVKPKQPSRPQSPPKQPQPQQPSASKAAAEGKPKKADKEKEKDKAKQKQKQQQEDDDVDDQTRRRRQVLLQRINDFNAATELFGKATVTPLAQRKPKTRPEMLDFLTTLTQLLAVFQQDPHYVPYLAAVLAAVTPPLSAEALSQLTSRLTVAFNERLKAEKAGGGDADPTAAAAAAKKDKQWERAQRQKADFTDAGLTTGGGRAALARDEALEAELDFM